MVKSCCRGVSGVGGREGRAGEEGMSVVDVKERYALAKAEVQSLREKLRAKRAERLDTDGESSSSHSCHLPMFSLLIYNIQDPTM